MQAMLSKNRRLFTQQVIKNNINRPKFHHVLFVTASNNQHTHFRMYSTHQPTTTTPTSESVTATIHNNIEQPTKRLITEQVEELENSIDSLSDDTFEQVEGVMDTVLHYISPARYLEDFFVLVHDMNVPWWTAIASTALIARIAMVKLSVNMIKFSSAKAAHMLEERTMTNKMMQAKSAEEGDRAKKDLTEYQKKHGIETWRIMYAFMQFPVFLTFLYTLRSMSQTVPSFAEGGLAWFTDLSVADPTLILPVISAVLQLLVFEIGNLRRFQPPGSQISGAQTLVKWVMRTFAFGSIIITRSFPAALFLYWIPSNIFQMCLTYVSKTDWFKKRYNIVDPTSYARGSINDQLRKKADDKSRAAAKQYLPAFIFKRLYPDPVSKAYTQQELADMRKKN
jgi:YidC/Oxa1 family membrane protein insertase